MKLAKWVLINSALLAMMWFGLVEGVEGALNIALLMSWLTVIISLFCLSDSVIKKMLEDKTTRTVNKYISILFDLLVASAFAWHGYIWLAGFWLVSVIFQEAMWVRLNELAQKTK